MPIDLTIEGDLNVTGNLPEVQRTFLQQENFAVYGVPLMSLRVWDALQTTLPGTSSADDLGMYGTAWGPSGATSLYVGTSDVKAAGTTTRYARFHFQLPTEYVSGQSVRIRVVAMMKTTAADTSATIDAEAVTIDNTHAASTTDLVTTSPISFNSTASATNCDFDVTSTSLAPGDWLDIRLKMVIVDAATGTAVIGTIPKVLVLCDIKG